MNNIRSFSDFAAEEFGGRRDKKEYFHHAITYLLDLNNRKCGKILYKENPI